MHTACGAQAGTTIKWSACSRGVAASTGDLGASPTFEELALLYASHMTASDARGEEVQNTVTASAERAADGWLLYKVITAGACRPDVSERK
jgi:hypothetical protein